MSFNLSISIVKNFHNVINCLNINRVTIYRTICLGIVTSKVLMNSLYLEENNTKFSIPKMKLNRINAS